jgi:hypothetical protein
MKKFFLIAAASLALFAGPASAVVICNNCTYLTGQPATNLGTHDPATFDNSTFGNSTTGQNGNFSNWWVFSIQPAGDATLDMIFLPIRNISNFAVSLFSVTSAVCGGPGSACSSFATGSLVATGTTGPNYVSLLDTQPLAADQRPRRRATGIVCRQPADGGRGAGTRNVRAVAGRPRRGRLHEQAPSERRFGSLSLATSPSPSAAVFSP